MSKSTKLGPVDLAYKVLETKTHQDGLDLFTAQAIIAVAKHLSPANRDKLNSMSLVKAVDICWKLVK